jgi:hypothetical protein
VKIITKYHLYAFKTQFNEESDNYLKQNVTLDRFQLNFHIHVQFVHVCENNNTNLTIYKNTI